MRGLLRIGVFVALFLTLGASTGWVRASADDSATPAACAPATPDLGTANEITVSRLPDQSIEFSGGPGQLVGKAVNLAAGSYVATMNVTGSGWLYSFTLSRSDGSGGDTQPIGAQAPYAGSMVIEIAKNGAFIPSSNAQTSWTVTLAPPTSS
jgi:hypothetical protein